MSQEKISKNETQDPSRPEELEHLQQVIRIIRRYPKAFKILGANATLIAPARLIAPPPGYDNLKATALIVCIVAKYLVLGCQDFIAEQVWQRTVWRRPALLFSVLVSASSIVATTFYVRRQPTADLFQLNLYIFLWLSYFTPIAVLLIYRHFQKEYWPLIQRNLDELTNGSELAVKQPQAVALIFYEEYGE